MTPVVREEFGPSLAALVRRRFGVPERTTWIVIGATAAVLLVAALAAVRILNHDEQVTHADQPQFTMIYPSKLMHPAKAAPGELQRFEGRRGRTLAVVSVRPLKLQPYDGDASKAVLPVYSETFRKDLEQATPDFLLTEEGKANVQGAPGWQLQYRTGDERNRTVAQDVLLLPDDEGSDGGVILSFRLTRHYRKRLKPRDQKLRKAARSTFRSFRFGTTRP